MWKKLNLDKIWVIDEEATCWDEKDFPDKESHRDYQRSNRELIELGIAEIDLLERKITNKWSFLIKNKNSEITQYCENLTSINQELINKEGKTLQQVSKELRKMGSLNKNIMAWGAFDGNFLREQCQKQNAKFPFCDNYINLSDLYAMFMGLNKGIGLKKALKQAGIKMDGIQHRGVWDAYNTAKLFLWLLDSSNKK